MPSLKTNDYVERLRLDLADDVTPYLWSDEELLSYLNDAAERFCRYTDGIADELTLSVRADDVSTTYSDRVLKIRLLRFADTGERIELLNFEDFEPESLLMMYERPFSSAVLGMAEYTLTWTPPFKEDRDVLATVWRMPLRRLTKLGQAMELPDHHFEGLLEGAKHRAYLKQDGETYDRGKSDVFGARFLDYCKNLVAVEQGKRRHKYRLVRYGGL